MLTSEAKKLLAETIRGTQQDPDKGLRARLLRSIHDEADRRYRLSVATGDARLDEAHRKRRERLTAWIDERARATKPKNKAEQKAAEERFLRQAEKEAAATLLNRLVLLRHLEALDLSKPAILTGGWNSKGYREFRDFAPGLVKDDETEGYAALLQLVFDELSIELPGLFGDVGVTSLFPVPASMLRELVERLDAPGLASAWKDDTTLGWVYQYWNDPDREALDAKINGGGKIEPHEIASKTQMFTERYMVEWLLQNSLGLTWLAMCKKHGWTPDADRVLGPLDERRADWRKKRDACEVALDALMPIHDELEEQWKYFVPQPIPDDAVTNAPESLASLKLLDPACGSGHFLVIAFGMLASLYREEARHTGRAVTDRETAESILENNLHGIDIDARAIQIAAAAVYLKAKAFAKDARPKRVNLVAPALGLGKLPADDPAVVRLRSDLAREAGIPAELTNRLLTSLAGVDYLGSLFKVDRAIDEAIAANAQGARPGAQLPLGGAKTATTRKGESGELRLALNEKLEHFLAQHRTAEDLGLRLDGEQLAAGVRFVRMAREGTYDIVVGNPPYQGLSKTASFEYVAKTYPKGKADLYAAFLERSIGLLRSAGTSGLVTMRGWMFLNQHRELREQLLRETDLVSLADLDSGAFEEVSAAQVVLSVACTVFLRSPPDSVSTAIRPTPLKDKASTGMTNRKRAGLLAQVGRYEFDPRGFEVIEGEPIVYWWTREDLARYSRYPKLGKSLLVAAGVKTGDDVRFIRQSFEVSYADLSKGLAVQVNLPWQFYIKGAAGAEWIEPAQEVISWRDTGLELKIFGMYFAAGIVRMRDDSLYFRTGISFSSIGSEFRARAHRYPSITGNAGLSVFTKNIASVLCLMNQRAARDIMADLNPTVNFLVHDVNRLPIHEVEGAEEIYQKLVESFRQREAARESSVEFTGPGRCSWKSAQLWAQGAVDLRPGEPLPDYEPKFIESSAAAHLSFAIGVALRRFDRDGAGILSATPDERGTDSILFATPDESLAMHPLGAFLLESWATYGAEVAPGETLSTYLRKSFFDYHKKLYENRPIYFPLSSAKKSFVAYCSIHRWQDDTLSVVLADHLVPAKRKLEGELEDLKTARAGGAAANRSKIEKRYADVQKLLEELNDFIAKVTEVAEKGPPPVDDKTQKREVDARYRMDLDDGVMVNSAALWPLLEPQWKDPKKWWKELANASGKKDYDWSHLAARYFPTRVRGKCVNDPSLGVAHGCFWELHPAKAYAWELRLQDEIRPDFTIDEPGSDAARARFLADHAQEAAEIAAKEKTRRERKAAKAGAEEDDGAQLELSAEAEDEESPDAGGVDA